MNAEELETLVNDIEEASWDRGKSAEHEARFLALVEQLARGEAQEIPTALAPTAKAAAAPAPSAAQWAAVLEVLGRIASREVVVNVPALPSHLEITKMPDREIRTTVVRDEKNRAKGTLTTERDKE